MRRFKYVGAYGHDIPMVAQCGNLVVVDAVTLLHGGLLEQILPFGHLKILLQLHILDEIWQDAPGFRWTQLDDIREGLRLRGALDRVVGILVDEECMTTAYADRPDKDRRVERTFWFMGGDAASPDPYARIDWCHRRWSEAVAMVRAAFPDHYVGAMETLWHDGRGFGPAYYRPVLPGVSFLALDAYVSGPITREAFDRQVRPIYDHAGTLGLPLLCVGQAFRDAMRPMPEPHEMQWWVEAAPASTVAWLWFTLAMPPHVTDAAGVMQGYPAQLAALRWYADVCDVVPDYLQVGGA